MPQSKNQVFSLSLAGWPHLARVESLHESQLVSPNSRIYYAFPPELKIADFGHADALSMTAEAFYFQDASSAGPVWLAEGFP